MLQVFGLQVSWPEKFNNLLFEISRAVSPQDENMTLGEVEGYSQLTTNENGDRDESDDLHKYLDEVLVPDLKASSVLKIMRVARNVSSSPSTAESEGATGPLTTFERWKESASDELNDLLADLVNAAKLQHDGEDIVEVTETSVYLSCSLTKNYRSGGKRVFTTMRLVPSKNRVTLYFQLPADRFDDPRFEDASNKGKLGVGDTQFSVTVGNSEEYERAVEAIALSRQDLIGSHIAS